MPGDLEQSTQASDFVGRKMCDQKPEESAGSSESVSTVSTMGTIPLSGVIIRCDHICACLVGLDWAAG